ncbi:hypothetical protein [Rhodococcus sp. ACT016]|uniref:hypothetical protein n=1 Tax=Rhodococcus sp. ACT016 TaxID=3134808 RepID=UPI003D2B8BCC
MNHELGDQATVTAITGDVVFIGSSTALDEAGELARAFGHGRSDVVRGDLAYAVVDDDVLDGICTAAEAGLLVQVRALEVTVLTVNDARTLFRVAPEPISLA